VFQSRKEVGLDGYQSHFDFTQNKNDRRFGTRSCSKRDRDILFAWLERALHRIQQFGFDTNSFGGDMTPTVSSDSVLLNIILGTLAIGLPVVMVLLIRFLWDRNLNLGRSKGLDRLIWQLHRIASAMEHQMNLSFPPVQPGTEEPRDLAYLKPIAIESEKATAEPITQPVAQEQTPSPAVTTEQAPAPLPPRRETTSGPSQRAGVNSMFGL
jgi:hypothetical protein